MHPLSTYHHVASARRAPSCTSSWSRAALLQRDKLQILPFSFLFSSLFFFFFPSVVVTNHCPAFREHGLLACAESRLFPYLDFLTFCALLADRARTDLITLPDRSESALHIIEALLTSNDSQALGLPSHLFCLRSHFTSFVPKA